MLFYFILIDEFHVWITTPLPEVGGRVLQLFCVYKIPFLCQRCYKSRQSGEGRGGEERQSRPHISPSSCLHPGQCCNHPLPLSLALPLLTVNASRAVRSAKTFDPFLRGVCWCTKTTACQRSFSQPHNLPHPTVYNDKLCRKTRHPM